MSFKTRNILVPPRFWGEKKELEHICLLWIFNNHTLLKDWRDCIWIWDGRKQIVVKSPLKWEWQNLRWASRVRVSPAAGRTGVWHRAPGSPLTPGHVGCVMLDSSVKFRYRLSPATREKKVTVATLLKFGECVSQCICNLLNLGVNLLVMAMRQTREKELSEN